MVSGMNRNVITVKRAGHRIEWMAGETTHAKRVQSVTNALVGVVNAVSLSLHAISAGLAQVTGLDAKHTIKQVDRLLSNSALNVWALFAHWVPYVLASSRAIVVALDWTDFDADGHSTIALSLITAHGRATPLVWMSVKKARLKGRRNVYEDAVLVRLHEVLPPGVQVTVLADRGFGDQKLYALLKHLGFAFIIRFRGVVTVESRDGEVRPASEWVPPNGQVRHLQGARVTTDRYALDGVVCVKARGMKDPWCLAVHGRTMTGATAVSLYARRFTIEETFRDTKDPRYGLGVSRASGTSGTRYMRRAHRRHMYAQRSARRAPLDRARGLPPRAATIGRMKSGDQSCCGSAGTVGTPAMRRRPDSRERC